MTFLSRFKRAWGPDSMARRVGFSGGKGATASRSDWQKHLLPGEEPRWEGRPGFGFSLNTSALLTLVVVGVGIAVLAPQILNSNPFGQMMTVPIANYRINGPWFVGIAIAWTLIWFLMQTVTTPWFTRYMLSDRRAFIKNIWGRVKSYDLDPLRAIEFDGRPSGNIIFATETRRTNNGRKRTFPVGFMHIEGAQEVYQLMIKIQQGKERHE